MECITIRYQENEHDWRSKNKVRGKAVKNDIAWKTKD